MIAAEFTKIDVSVLMYESRPTATTAGQDAPPTDSGNSEIGQKTEN